MRDEEEEEEEEERLRLATCVAPSSPPQKIPRYQMLYMRLTLTNKKLKPSI